MSRFEAHLAAICARWDTRGASPPKTWFPRWPGSGVQPPGARLVLEGARELWRVGRPTWGWVVAGWTPVLEGRGPGIVCVLWSDDPLFLHEPARLGGPGEHLWRFHQHPLPTDYPLPGVADFASWILSPGGPEWLPEPLAEGRRIRVAPVLTEAGVMIPGGLSCIVRAPSGEPGVVRLLPRELYPAGVLAALGA